MEKLKQFFVDNKKVIIVTISSLIFLLGLLIFFTYIVNVNSPFVNKVRSFFPMPAVIVGNSWITINEFEDNVSSTRHFYESQDFSKVGIRIDFDTEDGKKRLNLRRREILNRMIQDEIIKKIAQEYKVTVTDEEVESDIRRIISEGNGSREGAEKRAGLYGWTLSEYGDNIGYIELLTKKVEKRFNEGNLISDEKIKVMNQVKKELNDGRDFSDVAKKYSDGKTKEAGGALGWFKSGQLIDEVNQVAFSLESNKHSEIIESPLGLHIVKVTDFKILDDGTKLLYVNQIFVKRKTFIDFVEEKMNDVHIGILIGDYAWDKKINNVVVTSEEMKGFEKRVTEEMIELQKTQLGK
ncbi:MAG: peptidylprolyl isomerase [Candidatus Moranbacteria bacterium]|nr:peptidylprolyl isomerase [Candidatus Moranbacteria bacterium]